MVNIFEDLVFN